MRRSNGAFLLSEVRILKIKLFQKLRAFVDDYDDKHNFTCDFCGREVFENERVCKACLKSLPFNNGAICPFCGRKVGEAGVCLDCKEKPLGLEKARSIFIHEGEAMNAVLRYKKGARYFYRTFSALALPMLEHDFMGADFLTFVPLTPKAQKERGYNQSELIALQLARLSGLPALAVFEKKKETFQQKALGRHEREANLAGCFRVLDKSLVKGKKVVIVDDVLTTGATLSELARILKKAGTSEVYALTVTSVPRPYPFGKK